MPEKFCRAELDACYARLYGLTRVELRHTPFDVDSGEIRVSLEGVDLLPLPRIHWQCFVL